MVTRNSKNRGAEKRGVGVWGRRSGTNTNSISLHPARGKTRSPFRPSKRDLEPSLSTPTGRAMSGDQANSERRGATKEEEQGEVAAPTPKASGFNRARDKTRTRKRELTTSASAPKPTGRQLSTYVTAERALRCMRA
jgi:hypothetical protein